MNFAAEIEPAAEEGAEAAAASGIASEHEVAVGNVEVVAGLEKEEDAVAAGS